MNAADRLNLAYVVCGLVVLWLGWIKTARPRLRRWSVRFNAFVDTFVGRGEVEDEVTGQRLPAVLPIHKRLTGIERAQADQAAALKALAEVQASQTELHRAVIDHEQRIGSLEDVEAERTLTREEALEMWKAMNNRDVIDVDPEGNAL